MRQGNSILVVGAESLVGAELIRVYRQSGRSVLGTTRRTSSVSVDRVLLDLASEDLSLDFPQNIQTAFLCAATTSYSQCETDPLSMRVNVTNPVKIAQYLLGRGCTVIFLSTNTVFGGGRPFCNEVELPTPVMAYSRQKVEAESLLMDLVASEPRLGDRLCIVRLTKVLSFTVPPLPEWFARLRAGEVIWPFSDMIFAPMSLAHVALSLMKIADTRAPGIFHLSGAENVTYAELASRLVADLGMEKSRVVPMTSVEVGINLAFQPRYSAIGMTGTTKLLGILPEPMESVVRYLVEQESGSLRHLAGV